jgi:PleD family two-component response regulator
MEFDALGRLAKRLRVNPNLAQVLVVVVIRPRGILAVAKVLVVDDDPAVQMMTRLMLERAGHAVDVAGDDSKSLTARSMVTQCLADVTHTSPNRNVASSR